MKSDSKEPDFTRDPYWGKGGRYVVNPVTGKREPAPAVEEAPAGEPVPARIGERPDNAAPGVQIDGQGLPPVVGDSTAAAPTNSMKEKRRG